MPDLVGRFTLNILHYINGIHSYYVKTNIDDYIIYK